MRYEIYIFGARYYWRLVYGGKDIATSPLGYESREVCVGMIRQVMRAGMLTPIHDAPGA